MKPTEADSLKLLALLLLGAGIILALLRVQMMSFGLLWAATVAALLAGLTGKQKP